MHAKVSAVTVECSRMLIEQLTSELPVIYFALVPPVLQRSMLVPATTPHARLTMQSLTCIQSINQALCQVSSFPPMNSAFHISMTYMGPASPNTVSGLEAAQSPVQVPVPCASVQKDCCAQQIHCCIVCMSKPADINPMRAMAVAQDATAPARLRRCLLDSFRR